MIAISNFFFSSIPITSVYVCHFITTISYHSVTFIFPSFIRVSLSIYGWLCMIITLFLYPTNENTLEKVSLSFFSHSLPFFHNFILIHWIFICTYIRLCINMNTYFFLLLALVSLSLSLPNSVLCFAYYVLFCFIWQKFVIVRELYGLFYFVLNSVHEGETIYVCLLASLSYSKEKLWSFFFPHTALLTHQQFLLQKNIKLTSIHWSFTVSWLYHNFTIYLYLSKRSRFLFVKTLEHI